MSEEKIKVAGVPEHFNLPWKRASESKDADIEFIEFPGGTGAMCTALETGEVDVALLLTEGAIARSLNSRFESQPNVQKFKLLGFYVDSPLVWGVHVGSTSHFNSLKDLNNQTVAEKQPIFAISRYGSGSHLMSYVLMEQQFSSYERELNFKIVKNLDGAKEALPKDQQLVFMWEHFMTAPYVDSGLFKRIGDQPTPWPCFVIAVRDGALGTKAREAKFLKVLEQIRTNCVSFKEKGEESVQIIHEKYGIEKHLAQQWLSEVSFKCEVGLTISDLKPVAKTLQKLGRLKQEESIEDAKLSEIILDLNNNHSQL